MPRDLVVGNGRLLVCLDRNLFARDLYWPRVGLYNHLSGRSIRFGVWADGQFTWVDDAWDRDLRYREDSLVTQCRLRSDRLRLSLEISDAVADDRDVFVRRVVATDLSGRDRAVRLFLAPDTVLCETDIGDSVYYDPFGDAVVHYKRENYLLFSGLSPDGSGLFGFACGMKGVGGMEGTWRDAEDGELSNNPVAQGSVDSCLSLSVPVQAGASAPPAYFWMAAGRDRQAVLNLNAGVRTAGPESLVAEREARDQAWVTDALERSGIVPAFAALPRRVQRMYRRSLLVIRSQCDRDGAILAANDSDIMRSNRAHYSYIWPRDGALISHALDSAGCHDLSRAFFRFCQRILPTPGTHAGVGGAAFMQKYGPDGSVGSTWHSFVAPDGKPEVPIQEDETALVLWALEYHLRFSEASEGVRDLYETLALPCAEFLLGFRDPVTRLPRPSWDLWEERRGVHAFTVCAVIAGLRGAAILARRFDDPERAARYRQGAEETAHALRAYLYSDTEKRFIRRLEVRPDGGTAFDRTLDSSLHALHLFETFSISTPEVIETLRQTDERLRVNAGIGGMARYEGDYYARISYDLKNVPGNPWILCTLWQAQWKIATAETIDALEAVVDTLSWADLCALPAGILPEQIHPYNFTPTTVAPLTWSHSEFVETVTKWAAKYLRLKGEADDGRTHPEQ